MTARRSVAGRGAGPGSPHQLRAGAHLAVCVCLAFALLAPPAASTRAATEAPRADAPIAGPLRGLAQAGVSLAEDPVDATHLVAAMNDYNAAQGMSVAVSQDRGAHWTAVALPRLPQTLIGDPRLAYGPRGVLYLAGTAYDVSKAKPPAEIHLSINLLVSRDGGEHWTWLSRPSGPIAKPPVLDDYPSIAVDPAGGRITMAWTRILPEYEEVLVAQSSDGGRTFSRPLTLPGQMSDGASAALDRGGDPLIAYMDREHDALRVVRLHAGRVLSAVGVAPLRPAPATLGGLRFRIGSQPTLVYDRRSGVLYVTWLYLDGTHTRLALFSSTDDGQHWRPLSAPAIDAQADVFMPTLAASPAGVLGLLWYLRSGASYTVVLALSTDCGRAFAPPTTVDGAPSSLYGEGPTYLGDYGAVILDQSWAYVAWTDNRILQPMIYGRSLRIPEAARCASR